MSPWHSAFQKLHLRGKGAIQWLLARTTPPFWGNGVAAAIEQLLHTVAMVAEQRSSIVSPLDSLELSPTGLCDSADKTSIAKLKVHEGFRLFLVPAQNYS
jgi:hypothetical protein